MIDVDMSQVETFMVRRWRCPHCRRTRSSVARIKEHISQCWRNPDNRTCMTCRFYVPDSSEPEVGWHSPARCEKGVDFTGQTTVTAGAVIGDSEVYLVERCGRWGPDESKL
jgi:hypothetical protein